MGDLLKDLPTDHEQVPPEELFQIEHLWEQESFLVQIKEPLLVSTIVGILLLLPPLTDKRGFDTVVKALLAGMVYYLVRKVV